MKAVLWVVLGVLVVALGYLSYAHFSGAAVYTFGLPLGGERAHIRQTTARLFENVKFRNLDAIAAMVTPGESMGAIDAYLGKVIGVPPENFDLQKTLIEGIEIDSSNKRARARVTLVGENLHSRENMTVSKIIFLFYDEHAGWLFDIKNVSP